MGITDIGLSFDKASRESLAGVRVHVGDTVPNIYIKWRTISGLDWNGTFDIAADVSGVPRGTNGTGDNYYTTSKGFWSNVQASACNPTASTRYGDYQWSYPLDLGDIGDGKLLDAFSPWSWDSRKYDAIRIDLRIKSNYAGGKTDAWDRTHSDLETATLWIGYFPTITPTSASYTLDELEIAYTNPGWSRPNDRFAIETLTADGVNLLPSAGFVWGNIDQPGTFRIPMSSLSGTPGSASKLHVAGRFNASFRESGLDFADYDATVPLTDLTTCSTPKIKVTTGGGKVYVAVSDAGDNDNKFTTARVGISGSPYSFDNQTVKAGGTVTFSFPPLGETFTIYAQGFTSEARSKVVTATAKLSGSDYDRLDSIDGSASVAGRFSQSHDISFKRNREEIEIDGRSRPISAYGEGGTSDWKLKYELVLKPGTSLTQTLEEFRKLESCGDCVLRTANGDRLVVGIDSYSFSRKFPFWNGSVSISVSEVAYD